MAFPSGRAYSTSKFRHRKSIEKRRNNRRRNLNVRRRIDVDISTVFIRRRKNVEKRWEIDVEISTTLNIDDVESKHTTLTFESTNAILILQ